MTGKVYLVGAGPGDPDLITVKGLRCLRRADVLLYDRLVAPELVDEAPLAAERIFVGKVSGRHVCTQAEINTLMIDKARQGNTVVRLKGGDPFVFGRGGEEAQALAEAGIPFEVVPGITSAIGVPAYAGIPITHRDYASSVAIVAGHEDSTKRESAINWTHLAKGVDTLVILMGVRRLAEITRQLIRHGRAANTPAAVIEWGTLPDQCTVVGTLADIAQRVAESGLGAPAVIVIGEVVRLRQAVRWYPPADNNPGHQEIIPEVLPLVANLLN
jgi:uroporphyrinogen III methyltransferase/synthase